MPPCNETNVNISFIAKKHQLHFGICSGVGRTIETSALENLDGGQFTFIMQLMTPNYPYMLMVNRVLQNFRIAPYFLMYPYMGIYYLVYHQ